MNDLKFAFRQLLKHPGFTAVAVLTLALGISANTVVFSVVQTVLLRPLGFDGEEHLMWIRRVNLRTGTTESQLSWQDLEDIRTATQSFETVATDNSHDVTWHDGERSENVPVVHATPVLPDALRLRPVVGRSLIPSDGEAGAEPVVLISHELWQSRFGGGPDVLGQTVRLNQETRTIVGVLPPGVQFPVVRAPASGSGSIVRAGRKQFWLPMSVPRGSDATSRGARMFLGVGRLKAGVTEAEANAELIALSQRLAAEFPESNRDWRFEVLSFREQVFGRTLRSIPLLTGAVAAVLLICCVNLANLLLARGVTRRRELAVRLALGSSRRQLVRTVLWESAGIAIIGGGVGLLLALGGLQLIRDLGATSVPFIQEARLDQTAVLFTAGLSLFTALVFGLAPAWHQSRADAADALRTGARSTSTPRIRSWQRGLLVGQVAMVLVLLASASVLLESFRRLVTQDLGYRPQAVALLDLHTTGSFETNGDMFRMYRALRDQLVALPGVDAAGTISSAPLTSKWTFNERPNVVGRPLPEVERPEVAAGFVAFDYFQAMGIPLVEGRFFRDAESNADGYGQIVIVNETAAELLFPGRSAIGGQFTVGSNPDRVLEVIGVVKDTRDVRLEEMPLPRFYWQYAFGGAQFAIRSSAPMPDLMARVRELMNRFDARVSIDRLTPMTEVVSGTVTERRFLMLLLATYALVALGIAAVGIFGVVGHQVAQRTNEFGVRLALGATPGGVLRLVLQQAGRLLILGMSAGLAVSLATNRLLASQLFEVSPHDPLLLAAASLVLLGVGLLASLLPARRAASVDPMVALRHE
jgi:predicted permease